MAYLPRGNTLDDRAWRRRHRLLERVLLLHAPLLIGLGFLLGHSAVQVTESLVAPLVCLVLGHLVTHRRVASFFITGGLVFCSIALVLLTSGSIEAHFHFFIIIGFIALYQDWVPFLWNVAFTTVSHGIGTIWLGGQIFNHPAAQAHPWLWSFVHGVAVLFACVGMVIFWRITEDQQVEKEALGRQLITADAEIGRRQFTSEMLVNLARRNQSMLYRQLDIINELENKEQDPDALADLFKLDHLATRVRRNAESLLVLAGQQAPRTWSEPVPLRDVIRAAIAETEDLDRVVFAVDDRIAISGTVIADLTHLLAELTENAVRFSPPETAVTIRVRPNRRDEGGQLLTVEDWGVGMPPDDLAEANELLANPGDIDLAVAQRLGFHVVARLAARHGITVSLTATPGSGITAVTILPADLFPQVAPPGPAGSPPGAPRFDRVRPDAARRPGPGRSGGDDDGSSRGPVQESRAAGSPAAREPWMPPGPTSSGQDPSLTLPDVRWQGWWSPESQEGRAPNGQAPNGQAPNGQAPNGQAPNGQAPNGQAPNGHGANSHAASGQGTNGHGMNGHATSGHATSGQGMNGHATNGHGTNGHGTNGQPTNGHGVNAHAGNGHPTNGSGADGHVPDGHGISTHTTDGHDVTVDGLTGRDLDRRAGEQAPEDAVSGPNDADGRERHGAGRATAPAQPATPAALPPAIPVARTGSFDLAGGVAEPTRLPAPVPASRNGATTRPAQLVERPPTGPTPVTPLPLPRGEETATSAAGHTVRAPGSRGLRRRVPQSHLAPELRHPVTGLADTAAPLSAGAAASALSRYQASRLAAQAVVGESDAHPSEREGERE